MGSLLALDLPLGSDLERALRDCVETDQAFCVLDQRLTPLRRREQAAQLGATAVLDGDGRHELREGRSVDDEIGLVILTSGSSGAPKAAELTWSALRASARLSEAALFVNRPPAWLPCLPASHIGGLAVLLRAILDDATLVWGATDNLAAGPQLGATHVAVVRPQLIRYDLSGYQVVLLGGGRAPTSLAPNVHTTWGMTETGSGIVLDGRILPSVEVVAPAGELLVRSPTLFRSYRDSARPRALGPDGFDDWFPTGDAGEVSDGRVHVHGRLGFVITTGGEKIWPEDLESVFASLEGVHDVAVTSLPDEMWGERIVALVVSDGSVTDDALRSIASERIGPWAKPKEIRYVVALPRTSNGKLRRSELIHLH